MTKFRLNISLINVLESKFGSIYRTKKQRDSQKIQLLKGKAPFSEHENILVRKQTKLFGK